MNKTAFQALRSVFFRAFSLVELMVTLVVISCIISALVPAITKKLKSQAITVGSGGGGNTNLEFEQDCSAFGVDCALCFEDRCAMCAKSCEDDEFVNTPQCICESCTTKSENCITCTSKGCTKCAIGYGLSNTRICQQCQETQYSDGANPCTTCPENHYCNGSVSIACPSDSYAPVGSTSCTLCSETYSNCATCNSSECLTCKKGYKLKDGVCVIASGSQVFTTAGEHSFTVPEDIEELKVTLVSGGAGGGGGNVTSTYKDFTSTTTWTIPTSARGVNVKFSSVGGGGGKGCSSYVPDDGEHSCGTATWGVHLTRGDAAAGKAFKDKTFAMPNKETIKIVIGAKGATATATKGYATVKSNWQGGSCVVQARSGYGGGATYFEGYNNTTYAAGGGAGGKVSIKSLTSNIYICTESASGEAGGTGGGSTSNNIFSSYGQAGKGGAMRVIWDQKSPGAGGGAGQIVPEQIISVTPGDNLSVVVGAGGAGGALKANGIGANESIVSKILTSDGITLITTATNPTSMGATGGNYNGTTVGSAGFITNGLANTQITMEGYSNTNGSKASGDNGGAGGKTVLAGKEVHCSPGAGGVGIGATGSNATGFGGCGGGGAGAGGKGGAGAPGYVKISWGEE